MINLQLLFNLLLLLFWVRLWSKPEREFYFNPFLSGTVKLIDSALIFLKPVLFLPENVAAFVVIIFITLFKTLLFYRLEVGWPITLGAHFTFIAKNEISSTILFSTLHASIFLLRCWTLYLLVRWITPTVRTTRATEALAFFARPFSWIPPLFQPFALLALHGLVVLIIARTGNILIIGAPLDPSRPAVGSPFIEGPLIMQLLKTGWLAMLSMADGLMLMTRGLFALIIANLIASVFQARNAVILCSEGIELLLGRFSRRGTSNTGFDFTPLIFFFVVDLLYASICSGLYQLIHSPFFN